MRSRVKPRNPRSALSQQRRNTFRIASTGWRELTAIQRQSFIDNAITPGAAFDLYIKSNINLSLIDLPFITTYTISAAPAAMPFDITSLNDSNFFIVPSSVIVLVPVDCSLLIYATKANSQSVSFTNDSSFSPVISFPAGTDLSAGVDIINEWESRFGEMPPAARVCIKPYVFNTINGSRSVASKVCSNTTE